MEIEAFMAYYIVTVVLMKVFNYQAPYETQLSNTSDQLHVSF